jgi:hypothetical protein
MSTLLGYQDDEVVDWATATLHLQHLDRLQPPSQQVISEGLLDWQSPETVET